jgi:ribonuclease T2
MVPFDPPVRHFLAAAAVLLCFSHAVAARDRDVPGDFDFYVLSLSWSPTYCESEDNPSSAQCDTGPHGFIVHGLWPQYEHGYPEDCRSSVLPQRIPESIATGLRDLIPDKRLVFHEWRKHGICAGLGPDQYFALLRQAASHVRVPPEFVSPDRDREVSPDSIEAAFVAANPGLTPFGMSTECGREGLTEVRICLDRDLGFRRCPEIDRASCRADRIDMPAAR